MATVSSARPNDDRLQLEGHRNESGTCESVGSQQVTVIYRGTEYPDLIRGERERVSSPGLKLDEPCRSIGVQLKSVVAVVIGVDPAITQKPYTVPACRHRTGLGRTRHVVKSLCESKLSASGAQRGSQHCKKTRPGLFRHLPSP